MLGAKVNRTAFLLLVLAMLAACSSDNASYRAADHRLLCDADSHAFLVVPGVWQSSFVRRDPVRDVDCAMRIAMEREHARTEIAQWLRDRVAQWPDTASIADEAVEADDATADAPTYELEPYDDGKSVCLRGDPAQAARMGVAACTVELSSGVITSITGIDVSTEDIAATDAISAPDATAVDAIAESKGSDHR